MPYHTAAFDYYDRTRIGFALRREDQFDIFQNIRFVGLQLIFNFFGQADQHTEGAAQTDIYDQQLVARVIHREVKLGSGRRLQSEKAAPLVAIDAFWKPHPDRAAGNLPGAGFKNKFNVFFIGATRLRHRRVLETPLGN